MWYNRPPVPRGWISDAMITGKKRDAWFTKGNVRHPLWACVMLIILAAGLLSPSIQIGTTLVCLDWRLMVGARNISYPAGALLNKAAPSIASPLPQDILFIPSWLPAGALAALVFVGPRLLIVKQDESQCSRCSYDLTGNVSGVCPECGTPVPAKKEQESKL